MAIAGLLILTTEETADVETQIGAFPGLSLHGRPGPASLAAVLEGHSRHLEKLIGTIKSIQGVLDVYVTYLNIEDELDPGNPVLPKLSGAVSEIL